MQAEVDGLMQSRPQTEFASQRIRPAERGTQPDPPFHCETKRMAGWWGMRRVIFLHFLLLPCCAAAALAQTTGYIDIEGRITDSYGSPPPGVAVEATSPNLQGTRAGLTGKDGE